MSAHKLDFDAINRAAASVMPELLARLLPDAKVRGPEVVGRNPRRPDDQRPGSFSINKHTGKWADFATADRGGDRISLIAYLLGTSQIEAARYLAGILGLSGDTPSRLRCTPAPAQPEARTNRKSVDLPWRLFMEAMPLRGTIGETYLRTRRLEVPDNDILRLHPACPRGAERLPAIVAPMTDPVTNEFIGLHRTFLRPDGTGKADGQPKMMLGRAGVIRLTPDEDATTGLGLVEGIENGLTVLQMIGFGAVWAAGSAGGIANFPVLRGIECLTIFADADDNGVGLAAARACAERWTAAGAEVRIIPPRRGGDWNDVTRSDAA